MGRNRGDIEHPMAAKGRSASSLIAGASGPMDKLKEIQESEVPKKEQEIIKTDPKQLSSLKELLLFGRMVEKIDLGGISFVISTLTSKQQKKLVSLLMKLGNEDRLLEAKTYTLREAIVSINGIKLHEFYEDDSLSEEERAFEVISNLQSTLVDILYDEYEKLIKKSNEYYKPGKSGTDIKN